MTRNILLFLIALASFAASAPAQTTSPLIINPLARDNISLSGNWEYIVDPLDTGQSMSLPGAPIEGIFRDRKPADALELVEYRFTPDRILRVPGDWNSQKRELFLYEGPLWLRKTFDAPVARTGKRYFLYFGAVNYRASIYLNGTLLAKHEGGFTPFTVEITSALKNETNTLVVRSDNRLSTKSIPAQRTDWWNYGGITRDVLMISTPEVFIRDYEVRLENANSQDISVKARLDGGKAGQSVRLEIPELKKSVTLTTDKDGVARGIFNAQVTLWSPANPKLYSIRLSAGSDSLEDRIGFRTIERKGAELLLNGNPVFLKGINAHEESLLHPGRSAGQKDAKTTIGLAKELGANFIRLAHYPHDDATIREADAQGLLVWTEIPIWGGAVDWNSTEAYTNAKDQLESVITRDMNRASVIFWSVANETPPSEPRNIFLSSLIDHVKSRDPSRLVTAALIGEPKQYFEGLAPAFLARIANDKFAPERSRITAIRYLEKLGLTATAQVENSGHLVISDPLLEKFDVIALNEYFGWYYPAYIAPLLGVDEPSLRRAELAAMPTMRITTSIERPFIISEFGADAFPGMTNDERQVETESYQAMVFRQQFKMFKNIPNLVGIAPWVLKDFRSPKRTRDFYNRKGLVDETGRRKKTFQVLRDYYASQDTGP